MNKKKMIAGIGIVVFLCVAFFFGIHPIWLTSGTDLTCKVWASYTEEFESWENADDIEVNLDGFSGEFPSADSKDYRQLTLDFTLTNTSLFGLQGMCVYVKEIDCDNKKNVIFLHSYTYDEAGFETIRLGKEDYSTPFLLVYVGDLKSEEEIEERMVDIAKHTTYEAVCAIQWLGTRTYSWSAGDKLNGYVIENIDTGKKRESDKK